MYSSLLSKREIELFEKLHNRKVRDAETFNHEDYQGVKTSVVDKYPESAHFVYELLQNADDVFATYAEFMLFEDGLIFKHNGTIPFSITDEGEKPLGHINSITSIGNSSKRDNYNKIGKFGVGFKSVFTYTDTPEIYDDKFWFKIENLIVPCLLDKDNRYRNEGETLFYIPFKSTNLYSEIHARLMNLDNPIAFLKFLKEIKWKIIQANGKIIEEKKYTKEILEIRNCEDFTFRKILFNNYGKECVYLFFTEQYKHDELLDITVGYQYDNANNQLITENSGNVYCFFSTKENLKTAFISHAPFMLVDNRQNLVDNDFNDCLIEDLAQLAANALVFIRDYGIEIGKNLIDNNIIRLFPFDFPDTPIYSWQGKTRENIIKEEFKKIFEKEKLFLANDQITYVGINEAYTCTPVTILDYFSDKQLNELTSTDNAHFLIKELCSNKDAKDKLSNTFGVKDLKSESIASSINIQFMKNQSLEWVFKFYQYLINEAPKLWKTDVTTKNKRLPFKYAPIVLTHKNEWVAPYVDENTYNVYLNIGITDTDYNFVSEKILDDRRGEKFIKELGIKEPDKLSYIKSCILPLYRKENAEIEDENWLTHLFIIYDYFKSLPNNERNSFINLLKENLLLVSSEDTLSKPENLYIYSEELKGYFGSLHWEYVNNEFYKMFVNRYSEDEFSTFLSYLGCNNHPRLINETTDSWRKLYANGVERYSYIIDTKNYILDLLKDKIQDLNFSKSDSLYVWNTLCNVEFEKIKDCNIVFKKRRDGYDYQLPCKSDMLLLLQSEKWLYNTNGIRCDVSHFYIEDLNEVGYKFNKTIIDWLDIKKKYISLESIEGVSKEQIDNERRGRKFQSDADAEEAYALLMEKRKAEELRKQKAESKSSSDDSYQRKEQTKKDFDSMFSRQDKSSTQKEVQSKKEESSYEDKLKELETEAQKKKELEELRASIEGKDKYSFDWFNSLLALEFSNTTTDSKEEIRKSLSLEFGSINMDTKSERVLILSNPSRYIPLWLEEIGSIEVNFIFKNEDDVRLEFEVSSVREFQLLLKAKTNDITRIKEINWVNCIKATINRNNPIELIGKLQSAFKKLNFKDEDNLKSLLPKDIQFLFGPPGTGKTTTLAKRIVDIIANSERCKILVLAPTNKACDVICKKIIQDNTNEDISWLGRFVATGDETIETSGVLVDRDSELYSCNKCCIVSTIARLPYDGFKYDKLMDIEWDYVVFDEASMIALAYITFAIYKFEGSKFIVSGDPFQITPIVNEKLWEKENIYTMVNLDRFHNPKTEPHNFEVINLDTQYRSIPSIGELFSRYTYDGKLKHYRKEDSQRSISIDGITLRPINYITFHVDFYNSIFSPKKLSGSNIHVYSVLFVIEFCRHLIKSVSSDKQDLKVGIICPYVAEAQMIEKLLEQIVDIPEYIKFVVGTIHSFQGDECNMILAVFNPPRMANDNALINVKNIINVAISRAEDYLCIIMPDRDTKGYENYYELNALGIKSIEIQKEYNSISNYTCDELERTIFGKSFTIENNTFLTGHQLANVYSKPTKRYEFRVDDKAADVQFNSEIEFI